MRINVTNSAVNSRAEFPTMEEVRNLVLNKSQTNNLLRKEGDLSMENKNKTSNKDVDSIINNPLGVIVYVRVIKGDKKIFDKDGKFVKIEKNVDKEVEVMFIDRTKVKSVCSDNDEFSLSMGITICMAKKLCGGTSGYNKTLDKTVKFYENKLKREEERVSEKILSDAKKAKEKEKRTARKIRKETAAMEAAIEIQKEAYKRAMQELQAEGK